MYKEKQFQLKELKGISAKTIEEHLKLYSGYVKNTNKVLEQLPIVEDQYVYSELQRRLSFEFNGMKNHEYYFAQFEFGQKNINTNSKLGNLIEKQWGSFENWLTLFKKTALTRGVGWAMLYYDKENDLLVNGWTDEQHLGQYVSCEIILALDMWEHSYLMDYIPPLKSEYVNSFFDNVNWNIVENRIEG